MDGWKQVTVKCLICLLMTDGEFSFIKFFMKFTLVNFFAPVSCFKLRRICFHLLVCWLNTKFRAPWISVQCLSLWRAPRFSDVFDPLQFTCHLLDIYWYADDRAVKAVTPEHCNPAKLYNINLWLSQNLLDRKRWSRSRLCKYPKITIFDLSL